jgi:hypothetical protein
MLVQMLDLVLEVVVLVVGLESLQVVSLLGVLPLVLNTGMRGVVALSWRGGTVHDFPFVVLVLQLERVGSLIVVTMVVFVEVALVGKMFWIALTPLVGDSHKGPLNNQGKPACFRKKQNANEPKTHLR